MISHTEGPTNDFDGIDRNRVLINADPSKEKPCQTYLRPILAFNLIWIILFQLGVLLANRSQMSSLKT